MPQHRPNLKSTAVVVTIAAYAITAAGTASAFSTGNGGSQPPAQYNSSLPNLSSGQTIYEQSDSHGRIIVSPSSFPVTQPVSLSTTVPVSISTTIPTHEQGTASITGTVNVGNLPSVQGVTPASPFPVMPAPSTSPFPVSGTLGINNFPAIQYVAPAASSSAFPVNCLSGCSGGSGGSSTSGGVYNSTLPTYASGQTVTSQYDQNGRQIVSPFTISLPSPLPVAGQYNAALPVLTSGAYGAYGVDQNGLMLLSPQSNIQTGGGVYHLNPIPLAEDQVTQVRVDAQGNTLVVAATPIPITVEQVGNLIDRHNTIINASGSQVLLPYEPKRRGFMLQNVSSGDLWINLTGNAASSATPSFKVSAGTTFTTPPFYPAQNPVQIWGATAAQAFSVVTW